jgi:hypothetical protein
VRSPKSVPSGAQDRQGRSGTRTSASSQGRAGAEGGASVASAVGDEGRGSLDMTASEVRERNDLL